MRTLACIILAVNFPLLAMTQIRNSQSVKLKTLDERTVDLGDILQDNNLTIVYFFNESCRNLTDQFDYLENLAEEYCDFKLKIVAVYDASNGNCGQIKPFINGNDIGLETLIDVNGELQRAMGLPVISSMILTRYTNMLSDRYLEFVSYSPAQAEIELLQLLSNDNQSSYNDMDFLNN